MRQLLLWYNINMSRNSLNPIILGVVYFYVHFIAEVLCFFFLQSIVGDSFILWLAPFVYDILAFIPQILIGVISDRFVKIPFGMIGILLMVVGLCLFGLNGALPAMLVVVIMALGSACIHVDGAEVTLRYGKGKIAPAAIYVAGGSFGVAIGKSLAGSIQIWPLLILALTAIPVIILAGKYRRQTADIDVPCRQFDYSSKTVAVWLIAIAVAFVVMVRSYIGYGIPTAWNKTALQMVLLFSFMGIGKALGGILTDKIGIRKTAYISMLGALPFLVLGNDNMIISLIGIMFFSMTMAITLAISVSAFPKTPGFAFGITTVGLALGVLPIFFFRIDNMIINIVMIVVASIMCLFIIEKIARKEKK